MTPVAVPHSRPQLTRESADAHLRALAVDISRPVLLAVRGYYRDTMGVVGVNDTGQYDDAIFLLLPNGWMGRYNANTDPSKEHPGVATLKAGQWLYKLGIHGLSRPKELQYQALVQAAGVTVLRAPDMRPDTGFFGINIHRGSINSTSSEGCQTIYPTQWDEFIGAVREALQAAHLSLITYVLLDGI